MLCIKASELHNILNARKIFLVTVPRVERSFSKLKPIKNYLKISISQVDFQTLLY